MATRTQVREQVIFALYGCDMGNMLEASDFDDILQEKKIVNEKKNFANDLFYGSVEKLEDIDMYIQEHLKDWDLSRIGYMQRAIFRLGVYEIIYEKTDARIVISDLLKIAKEYCDKKSISFINGVLNSISNINVEEKTNIQEEV